MSRMYDSLVFVFIVPMTRSPTFGMYWMLKVLRVNTSFLDSVGKPGYNADTPASVGLKTDGS